MATTPTLAKTLPQTPTQRPARRRLTRAVFEALDARQLLCAVPHAGGIVGTSVPWISAPITAGASSAPVAGTSSLTGVSPQLANPAPRELAATPAPIRINAGGGAYTDPSGTPWLADRNFVGGTATVGNYDVLNTTADPLYLARRYGAFNYNVPVSASGSYAVRLHFNDPLYTVAGKRKFSVKAEGQTLLSNFDIAASAGWRTAIVKTVNINVSDGTLNLAFVKNLDNPIVSAIEVIAQQTSPNPSGFKTLTYTNKAPAPLGRAEGLTASWGTRLYVFGGFSGKLGPVSRSDYYDTATNTWHPVQKLPQAITHAGVAQDANNVYIVGGYIGKGDGTGYAQIYGSSKVRVYNFASNTYSSLPDLPRQLAGGGAAVVNRKLHYFGGNNLNRTDTNVHLVLNLDNLAAGWKIAAPMLHGRSHMGTVVYDGKIWTIAGQIGNDGGLTTKNFVEVFDPATGQWTSRAPMPQSVSHMQSATFVMGDRIIVMGGETAHNTPIRSAWAYTPATNSWTSLSPLPATRFSGVAGAFNGKIFFTTGSGQTTNWMGTPG